MAPLVEALEPRKVRTYEDMMCDALEEANDLSWIHYLGELFQSHWCAYGQNILFHRVDQAIT